MIALTDEARELRIKQINELFESLKDENGTLHEQWVKRQEAIKKLKVLDPDMSLRSIMIIRSIKSMPKLDWKEDSFNKYFETHKKQ